MFNSLSANPLKSKGRLYKEFEEETSRTPFERDRDRIIHSSSFRKLKHKTQVFIESDSDYYRTRLTHSLEVAQISRSLCRAMNLNEDLGEVVSLAHDLGHPPFGHNGENALNTSMKNFGGFNHNDQTLRVVTQIEKRHPEFDGLNLTWESLEGIVKHNGIMNNKIPFKTGNAMPIGKIPEGLLLHNIELKPGKGAQMARSAGSYARIMASEGGMVTLKLPSGELRMISEQCIATIGTVGNKSHENISIGKAGRARWMGRRPKVRGVAMNPVDHPHGGGEGRTSGGRHPSTPWGKPTKGYKTRKNKRTDKSIIRSRRRNK